FKPYDPHNHPHFDVAKAREEGGLMVEDENSDTLTYIMPIPGSDLFVGGSLSLGEIRAGAARLVKATTAALALLSLIGLALFLSLTRRISRSLDTLTDSLSSVAEGDYSPMERSRLSPLPKELRDIAEAIEYLKEEVRTSIDEIREQGIRDSLTGLHNRRFFEETIRELGKGHMDPVTVVMCDVNGLKLINDGMGHKWGDRLIERAKEVLLEIAGEQDTVARIGGDEFAVVMPQNDGSGVDLRFRDIVSSANSDDIDIPLYMAWGTASGNAAARSIDEIVKDADERMYALKEIQREDARGGILKFFLNTIKSREKRRTSHMDRCRDIMDRFLKTIPEVDGLFRKRMVRLAAIHDIGLIGVDSEILAKKGPLNDEEMREVRSHPEIGYRIAFAVPNLSDLADPILHHHQRWDG
ncbi:MAG: diguanylate cyclase, partial [Synergistales bacterium]|nr:diguanylate cyclase [Synergistales bacterium]